MDPERLIPCHGGYRKLKSFQVAQLCLDYEDFLRQRGLACWAPEDPRRAALVDRQIEAQAAAFEAEGGFTERLYRVRRARRLTPPQTS